MDDRVSAEGSPTEFVLEESEEESEANTPWKTVFATLNMDEDYNKGAAVFV